MSELVKRLRDMSMRTVKDVSSTTDEAADRIEALEAEVQKWRGLENAAANHVEAEICMRSRHFTGEPPYVGWEGLGLALREDYARMTALEAENARLMADARRLDGLRSAMHWDGHGYWMPDWCIKSRELGQDFVSEPTPEEFREVIDAALKDHP